MKSDDLWYSKIMFFYVSLLLSPILGVLFALEKTGSAGKKYRISLGRMVWATIFSLIIFFTILVFVTINSERVDKDIKSSYAIENVEYVTSSDRNGRLVGNYVYNYNTKDGGVGIGYTLVSDTTVEVNPEVKIEKMNVYSTQWENKLFLPFGVISSDRYSIQVNSRITP